MIKKTHASMFVLLHVHVYIIIGYISISVCTRASPLTKRRTMYMCAHQSSVSLEQESSQETEWGECHQSYISLFLV